MPGVGPNKPSQIGCDSASWEWTGRVEKACPKKSDWWWIWKLLIAWPADQAGTEEEDEAIQVLCHSISALQSPSAHIQLDEQPSPSSPPILPVRKPWQLRYSRRLILQINMAVQIHRQTNITMTGLGLYCFGW